MQKSLYPRQIVLPTESFFLFGARGTGKTSLLDDRLKPALEIELLSQEAYLKYGQDPALLRRQLETLKPGQWVWIDEVQRLPELLNEVHWGIEKKRLRFALSGSSARKLRKAGVNLLAGRALSRTLFPLTPQELSKDFNLEKVLQFGSIPLIITSSDPKDRLKAYVHAYLKEEIQAEAYVKDIPYFARFLKVASLLHGRTLSLSSVARDVGVKRPTIENYFSVLEDTLLAYRLPPLESGLRVKERRHPKFYWVDPGLVNALREDWGPPSPEERGALFEGLICMLLRAAQSYRGAIDEIHYWSSGPLEVDFVIKKDSRYTAIEVKSGSRHRNEDCAGLRAISGLKKLDRRVIIYPKIDKQRTADGIEILSYLEFFETLSN